MKNSILIFCAGLAIVSLTAFGINSMNHTASEPVLCKTNELTLEEEKTFEKVVEEASFNFYLDIGSRFGGITLAEIQEVTTFYDFISEEDIQRNLKFSFVEVIEIVDDRESDIRAGGYSTTFNEAQLEMLHNSGYFKNLKIEGKYREMNPETGEMEEHHYTPHLTIVPEYEATYSEGIVALLEYLRINSAEAVASSNVENMRPAKLYFTINTEGRISSVTASNSCGFKHLDDKLEVLIWEAPGTWEPARSATGEKLEQKLVLTYGLAGC